MQLNLHHARALDDRALADLARRAEGEGLRLLASGDFLQGDGRERGGLGWVHAWLTRLHRQPRSCASRRASTAPTSRGAPT